MSAAINLGVAQAYGLAVAGIIGTSLILTRNRRFIKQFRAEVSTEGVEGREKTHA
jgi:hypothetical protein